MKRCNSWYRLHSLQLGTVHPDEQSMNIIMALLMLKLGSTILLGCIETNEMRQGPISIEEINKSISLYFMAILEWKILTQLENVYQPVL